MLLLRDRPAAPTELQDHDDARERIETFREQLGELEETIDELERRGGFDYYSAPG